MADITLGDLLHWDRGYTYLPPVGKSPENGLDTVITWAVTIRATPPILPAIRGGEIVVVPPRLLHAIESSESIDRMTLLRTLANQPIAAILVDPSFEESPVDGTPLILSAGISVSETESMLNRLLTERRAELYRLGSELTRALSTVSIVGAGLDALLNAASGACNRDLLLFGADGTLLAGSMTAPDVLELRPDIIFQLDQAPNVPRAISLDGESWLAMAFQVGPGRDNQQRLHRLAVGIGVESSHDTGRLVLSHVSNAIELLLSQAETRARSSGATSRANREALLSELLLGRIVSRDAADARARLLGLDPAEPARIALIRSRNPNLSARAHGQLSDERGRATAELNETEFAVVMAGKQRDTSDLRDLSTAFRSISNTDDTASMVISGVIDRVSNARSALAQARLSGALIDAGAIDGPVVHLDDALTLGLFGLFLPLASGDADTTAWQSRLEAFATELLAPIAGHDDKRGSELIATLAAYLREGGALAQAADALGVHRNTLSYRLGRIEELTGRDLSHPRTRFLFQIALDARTLVATLST